MRIIREYGKLRRSNVDLTGATWRKSSFSGNNGGDCVEITTDGHLIVVRDSKDRSGPVLNVVPGAWRAFIHTVKAHQA